MWFEKPKLQKRLNDFKFQLLKARHESDQTQTQLAATIGVSQPTLARWESSEQDQHFPAALILELPPPIKKQILSFLLAECEEKP